MPDLRPAHDVLPLGSLDGRPERVEEDGAQVGHGPRVVDDEGRPGERDGLRAGGRYWDRTSDLFRVREARYRCANRPG